MKQLSIFDIPVKEVKQETKQSTINLAYEYANKWQPKTKFIELSLKEVKERTHHGWLLPYLYGIDAHTNKRWEFWVKANRVKESSLVEFFGKGLTEKFLSENLYCHSYPVIDFNESGIVSNYLMSVLKLIMQNGTSLQEATNYFLSWLLYGFGHELFCDRPKLNSTYNCEVKLYQYVDLFPLLYYPADYWSKIMADVFPMKQNQATGFFPTPASISKMMTMIVMPECSDSFVTPHIQNMGEPSCGTGTMVLEYSNSGGMCIGTVELQEIIAKTFLVNCYLYNPQYARPIWYLLENNSIVCGNSLTVETFIDYHKIYKQNILNEFV